ncbi:MAG TPA: rod shape-determining protein RodA [Actinobacteria bacterium]|nr:rod shape-determining protein RodA [Actinomycetota bacterium]
MDLFKLVRRVDLALILTVLALVGYGTLMVYSATRADPGGLSFLRKQILWIVLGFAAMASAAFFNYNRLRHYTIFIYLFNLVLLIAVFFVGYSALGARRWIPIGSFNFQPSEFAKLFLIIVLASFLATRRGEITRPVDLLLTVALVSVPLFLIFLQPDLGTALVIVAILLGMLLVGGIKTRHLLVVIASGFLICLLVFQFNLLKEYQMKRLMVFVNPDVDPLGAGYNLLQSKIAIGSGQLFGKGLFSGTQTRLQFIPSRHTDFIFAVVGEELGFVGGVVLLILYFIAISRGIRIATTAKDMFGAFIAAGVVSMWLFQIFINLGMTIGIMPITGIPLPFFSYGGSSMMTHLTAAGLLLSVYARRFK